MTTNTSPTTSRTPAVKVEIQLLGRPYTVACEAGEEKRLEMLAGYLDSKMRALAGGASSATETRLFMLAALMLADEVYDLKASGKTGSPAASNAEHEATYAAAVENLTNRLQGIVKRLQSA